MPKPLILYHTLAYFVFGLVPYSIALSSIFRVPEEFATIQEAVDWVQEGDTVTVATGIYPESLGFPPYRFTLLGLAIGDSTELNYPIVDPSSLEGSDRLACAILPSEASPVIKNFRFKNSSAMFPRASSTSWGGVVNGSDREVEFIDCVFDSTYGGISPSANDLINRVVLRNCRFEYSLSRAVSVGNGSLSAYNCFFFSWQSNVSNRSLVLCGDSSFIQNCHFTGNVNYRYLNCAGIKTTVRRCLFGPSDSCGMALGLSATDQNIIEENTFSDLRTWQCVARILYSGDGPVHIVGNIFSNNRKQSSYLPLGVVIQPTENYIGLAAIFENNVFENCEAIGGNAGKAIEVTDGTYAVIRHNRFINLQPPSSSVLNFSGSSEASIVQNNLFIGNGYAIKNGSVETDAINNYWGDPSGPYNTNLNPLGQGDSISNGVTFSPWYTDTLFFNEADEPHAPLPKVFSLSVYPNPFNSFAKIKLEVPEPMIVRVELFDLLGRRVKEIYNAPVAREKEISFTAENSSSGVYFVRAKDTIRNRPLATKKLLLMK